MTIRQVIDKVKNYHTIKAYRNYSVSEDYAYYAKLRSEYLGEFRLGNDALENAKERIDLNREIVSYQIDDGVLTIIERGNPIFVR